MITCGVKRMTQTLRQEPVGEGVTGTRLQVLLELGGPFPRLEGNAADQFPWTVLCRMEVGALVVPADVASPGGGGVVTVYQHCDYGGYAANLSVGSYTLSQLQALGVLNDDISSVRVTDR